jgi:predicted nucleic acid-binding protein
MEENSRYLHLVDPFFEAVVRGDIDVITSALTLTEVLNYPIKREDIALAQRYSDILLNTEGLTTLPVSTEIAIEAAALRAKYRLKTPDAVQLATAKSSGATTFLTNDNGFGDLPGLRIVALDRLLPSVSLH